MNLSEIYQTAGQKLLSRDIGFVIGAAMQVRQHADVKYGEALQASIEALAPHYPEHTHWLACGRTSSRQITRPVI